MKSYERNLNLKYYEGLKQLRKELDPQWVIEQRKSYLRKQIISYTTKLIHFYVWYREATERGVDYLVKKTICILSGYKEWEKKLAKARMEYEALSHNWKGDKLSITQDMIEVAKSYPLDQLIEINKRGFAHCPLHSDKHPSLYTKNGFLHCFQCGWSGDAISLYQELKGVDFKEAVRVLSQGQK